MNIGIFDALRIYRNPLTFFVRVEKDSETKKYGVSFCLKKDDGSVHTIRRWSLISEDLNVVINKTETFLKLILVHGSKAYLEKGTYLFNHYNSKSYDSNEDGMSTDDEKYVLSENDVLTESKVNAIIFNLKFQAAQQVLNAKEDASTEYIEVFIGTILPQGEHVPSIHV